ncbi:MAG: glycosyltransferase [Synergistaceae bacterium]|jgi:glycosyltransferase involved in cell wall biosynthesis|nr:glycosyltransferase [Synergistaceae bacterium]
MPGLLIATTVPGTIRAFLLPYADYFRSKGWNVDAMSNGTSSCDGLSERFDSLFDVDWRRNPLDPTNLRETAKIRDIVVSGAYDIVHVHTPVAAFVTRLALRKLRAGKRVRVVYTAHGFHFHKGGKAAPNFIYRTLERRAGRWADRIVVINAEDFDAAKKYRITDEASLRYMPGIGLDFSKYETRTASDGAVNVRAELGLADRDVLYTMAAEFIPRKRHHDAIEALSRVKRTDIHIAFAGDGPLREKTRDLACELGVAKQAHFLGFREDIPELIAASRATILASEREGLARVLMESACLGVPIIGADARGIRDVVLPDRGLLYPIGDQLALRDAMLRVADDPLPPVKPDDIWRIENLIAMHEELYADLMANDKKPPQEENE